MTIYSQGSSSQNSHPTPLPYRIVSDDELSSSVEVFLAIDPVVGTIMSHPVSGSSSSSSSSASSSHSSSFALPRYATRRIIHPPDTVVLEPQPGIVPYAQLCFDQELNAMSTMLVGTKMDQARAPHLTLSSDGDDDDDVNGEDDDYSHTGWSTGYSSDDSDSLDDDHRYHHHHHHHGGSHGVVWISREWWTRDADDANDERALLPELRLTRSNSSGGSEESTAASFLSLKSCGKLFFCHFRGGGHGSGGTGGGAYYKSSENGHPRGYSHHHHHHAPVVTAGSIVASRARDKNKDHRFYGYQLIKH